MNVSAIYSGIFGLLAISAGFLSTFYVFIATRSNRFLDAIRHTMTFRQLNALLRDTIAATLLAVLMTFVVMVIGPEGYDFFSITNLLLFLWCWLIMLIATNFTRCTRIFFSLVEMD